MAFLPSRGHLCHPAQKRGRLTAVVKGPAFTQTKMTDAILSLHFDQGLWWRVLRILSETLQGFSGYSLISGIVSIFFSLHWVKHLNLGSLSLTADSRCCKLPKRYDSCHTDEVRESPAYLFSLIMRNREKACGAEARICYIPVSSKS